MVFNPIRMMKSNPIILEDHSGECIGSAATGSDHVGTATENMVLGSASN